VELDDPLISVEALRAGLTDGGPVTLLDVRWRLNGPPTRPDYERGHLPGAAFVDLETDLSGAPGEGGRHPLPDSSVFVSAMRRCGVRRDVPVVCYDEANGSSAAARCWWLLAFHGHRRASILDGGLAAWVAAGGELESGAADPPSGDFEPGDPAVEVIDAAEAARLARDGVLLDARAGERYRGEEEPIDPVAGHIPGARSAPTMDNVDEDGRFLPPERLREHFAEIGVTEGATIGVYCGSGVTAAHEVAALRRAGIDAALYPGSWSGWIVDPGRPVATGPAPG
jgi:thiosulfate/3-mercaptopyruvate sulfurtransferase